MTLERKIKLNDNIYYIGFKLRYIGKKLCKKDGSYFDSGDLTKLIEYVEENYSYNTDYDTDVSYMNDVIYIYDRFPYLEYLKSVSYDKNSTIIEMFTISKSELDDYISSNSINIGLFDFKNSISPLLFK